MTDDRVIELAQTLTLIDRNLVRVTRKPFASVYGLPTGTALDRLNSRYTFMFTIHTDHAFAKGNHFFKPLDELVTRGVDLEAVNSVDAVKRVMHASPFYFAANEDYGVCFSEVPFEKIMSDATGKAILDRQAQSRRLVK